MPTTPTIHLNGTGAKTLYKKYHEAWKAAHAARESLVQATCNGRDFYPQGDHACIMARKERDEHLANIYSLIAYLEAWLETALDSIEQ